MSNSNSTVISKKANGMIERGTSKNHDKSSNSSSIYFYTISSNYDSSDEESVNHLLSIENLSLNQIIDNRNINNKRCLVFELLHRIKAPDDIRSLYIYNKPGNFDPRTDRIKPMIDKITCISPYAIKKIKEFLNFSSIDEATNLTARIRAYEEYYKSRGEKETELYHKFSEITYGMEYADFFEIFPVLRGMNNDPDLYLFMVSYHLHNPKNTIKLENPTIYDVWKLIIEYQKIKDTYKAVEP
uniref:FLYWCH-type domain-containing protein n=1 Tax=Strongyloides papillosus TaxID=174720 RepID=A0A0N5BL04_STREA